MGSGSVTSSSAPTTSRPHFGPRLVERVRPRAQVARQITHRATIGVVARSSVGFGLAIGMSQGSRPPVAVPVARPDQKPAPPPVPVPVARPATAPTPASPSAQPSEASVSPWVRNRTGADQDEGTISVELGATHDSGLLKRGVHTEIEHD